MNPEQPTATDPVCGMAVDIEHATAVGLTTEHQGTTYCFCGKGCKHDFVDHPETYLDPSHTPSM